MLKQIAIAAVLATVASSSFAADPWSFDAPSPYYLGGDVGSTRLDKQSSNRHNGFGGYLGYDLAPNFAVEVGARRLAEFDVCCARVKIEQANISLISTLPLGAGIDLLGRIGYNKLNVTATGAHAAKESTSGSLYGVGVGYTFSPTVSARAELQKPSSDSSNISIGVTIRY